MKKDILESIKEIERFSSIEQISDNAGNNDVFADIIKAVDNISDKISLLALNTALENARTGYKDCGMTEVSAQMSRLAERVSENAKNITRSITDFQTGIESAKSNVSDSKKYLDLQQAMLNKVKTSLNEMFKLIQESQEILFQFTAKSQEASAAIENTPDTDDIQNPVNSIDPRQQATQQLNHHIDKLRSWINNIKL